MERIFFRLLKSAKVHGVRDDVFCFVMFVGWQRLHGSVAVWRTEWNKCTHGTHAKTHDKDREGERERQRD